MAISKRLRFEVLRRDGHRCRYCGATAAEARLVVDAVLPEVLGGSHKDPANLVAACDPCNSGKTSSHPDAPLVADVAADAPRWSRAMAIAADEMRTQVTRQREGQRTALEHFEIRWMAELGVWCERPSDWASSILGFLAAGLTLDILEDCVTVAKHSSARDDQKWRYMCGVAWRRLSELQQRARAFVAPGNTEDEDLTPLERSIRREMACELLGSLTSREADIALNEMRSVMGDDPDVETYAALGEFHSAVRDRRLMVKALRYLLDRHHPDGTGLLDQAYEHLETVLGSFSETELVRVAALKMMEMAGQPSEVAD